MVAAAVTVVLIMRPSADTETVTLQGADAAYAEWIDEAVGGCSTNLFVGFVDAAAVQLSSEEAPQPHSDLQAILSVNCPQTSWNLEGVVQAADCPSPPEMASLESAAVSCGLTVESEDGAAADLTLNLGWTASGAVVTETFPDSDNAQHTRTATVVGEVTVDVTADDGLVAVFSDFGGYMDSAADDVRITHFQETLVVS